MLLLRQTRLCLSARRPGVASSPASSAASAVKWLLLPLITLSACRADSTTGPARESTAGQWQTWVLPSASAIRPAAPPAAGSAQEKQELDDIVAVQATRTATTDSLIRFWDTLPTTPWHEE